MQQSKDTSIAILLLFTLAGCTTMQPLGNELSKVEIAEAIEVGDQIKIVTMSGGQHLVRVSTITEERVTGEGREFKLEDIARIEVEKSSTREVVGGVVGGVIGYVFIMLIPYLVVAAAL